MENNYLQLRKHIEEIILLTDDEWKFISSHFTYGKLRKHQFLIQKGNPVFHEYWIIKGLLKSYALDDKGKEYILQFAMENYWISDYCAYQNACAANLYIECIEDSEFFSIKLEDRETICKKVPAMSNFFRTKSNYGYIALQQRVLSLLTETAEDRYYNLLNKVPLLFQRVPKKMLAAYLGVTRETLSRLRS